MGIYEELTERGLIAQVTDEENVRRLVNEGKATFYIGFDPTADSLHVGHFMALCLMKRLQEAGNKPIALVGGGTGMIGDPSGRSDMRSMMTNDIIDHNCECFKKQMSRFIKFGEGSSDAMMVNNADWLRDLNFMNFMREVGVHFNVNNMLRARAYENRMEREGGLTFFEMSYMLLQAYDFFKLYTDFGCNLEFGGDDQWSNMLAGTDLIRKKLGKDDSYAMTITLLTKSDGTKMGKTSGGAVWLDANKTTPYDFYQYWRNVDDSDVIKCIKMLTFLPLEEIRPMEAWEGGQLNEAKDILAYELTKLVHGEAEAEKAREASKALFAGGASSENIPALQLSDSDLGEDGTVGLLDLIVKAGFANSKNEARQSVTQNGVTVNGEVVADPRTRYQKGDFSEEFILRKGKKKFIKVVF
ncbi:MAG: tyrosine--tRNA ligase [Lachnospiraceae bacterium]|jgi:tyrosyl-tRNA synthetase|nr:tyrosine--tRNA ligase [Lachnospiraceae bacterium]MCR5211211.1 tyrosine--tRNA ligase [Lachnospiraceae bacterium]